MRGKDLLANQRLVKAGEAVNQVLANRVKRVGDNDAPGLPAPRGSGEQNADEAAAGQAGMKDILDMLSGEPRAWVHTGSPLRAHGKTKRPKS